MSINNNITDSAADFQHTNGIALLFFRWCALSLKHAPLLFILKPRVHRHKTRAALIYNSRSAIKLHTFLYEAATLGFQSYLAARFYFRAGSLYLRMASKVYSAPRNIIIFSNPSTDGFGLLLGVYYSGNLSVRC